MVCPQLYATRREEENPTHQCPHKEYYLVRTTDVNEDVYKRQEHDFLGIIGPNGGGKTTLIRLILGLKKPMKGQLSFYKEGKPVKHLTMGYLPQYNAIDPDFPISVEEVVLSGLSNQKKLFHPFTAKHHLMVSETLEKMQLYELRNRAIGTLSGGQLQRVLLARAIVSHPTVLVLDEPNTYIDRHFQTQIYEMLHPVSYTHLYCPHRCCYSA